MDPVAGRVVGIGLDGEFTAEGVDVDVFGVCGGDLYDFGHEGGGANEGLEVMQDGESGGGGEFEEFGGREAEGAWRWDYEVGDEARFEVGVEEHGDGWGMLWREG